MKKFYNLVAGSFPFSYRNNTNDCGYIQARVHNVLSLRQGCFVVAFFALVIIFNREERGPYKCSKRATIGTSAKRH